MGKLKQDYLQMRVLELAPEVYVSGQVFAEVCAGLERPLLIFSATGVRSTKIWEMSE